MSSSQTITNNKAHPGQVLQMEFLDEYGITAYKLAKDIGVPASTVTRLIHGQTSLSPMMALRLERYFGMDAETWLNMQRIYDLAEAKVTADIDFIKPFAA